jgi:subtilisin family serine protease
MLGVPSLWAKTKGKGITIAVIDTGASVNHPDLVGAIADAQDFTGSPYGSADKQGHSTHCCGIIGARDNQIGIVGVAPEATVVCGKVLGDNGSGSGVSVSNGILWAVQKKVDIISMSLGSPYPDQRIKDAIDVALAAGIPVIAAAGNEGPNLDTVGYPARFPGVISVGSIDRSKQISRFSSRGDRVDIAAPGDQITSTYLNNGYATLSGTSMATPFVAGVCALLLAVRKAAGMEKLTPDKLIDLLHRTSVDLGSPGVDTDYGFGLVNPEKLLVDVIPVPPPVIVPIKQIVLGPSDLTSEGAAKIRQVFGGDIALTLRTV